MAREITYKAPRRISHETLLFGSKSSPCNALFVKNKYAETSTATNSALAEKIERQFYMDDYLYSCDNVEDAIVTVKSFREIYQRRGFEMHGRASNDVRALRDLPERERIVAIAQLHEFGTKKEKVLELHWYTRANEFSFELGDNLIPGEILRRTRKPTKREYLRVIMSVFDILGFLAPLVVAS